MEWKLFKRKDTKRAIQDAELNTPSTTSATGLSFASMFIQNNAMALSTVYRCTQIISESIAVLPINVITDDGVRANHSLEFVFRNTNNLLTKFELMSLLVQSVILKGNGFAYIERNGDGSVKNIRFLESSDVNINYNKTNNTLYYSAPLITQKKIEPVNMIHLKMFTYDGVNGIGILNVGNRTIKIANTTEQATQNFFDSGCNLSGVLSVQSSLTPQQIKDIKNAWRETYTTGNGGVAVLQGNMSYQSVSQNAVDSQLLESREYNVQDICRLFGINPILLGVNKGNTYGSLEAAQNEFVLHTLLPYIVCIEEEFTKKLLKPSERGLRINLDESFLLRTNKESEAKYYTTLTNAGIIRVAEAREKLGYPYKEDTDKLIVPYTKIEDNTINNQNKNNEQGNKNTK